MNETLDAFVRSWPWHPWLWAFVALSIAIYARGFVYWHGRDPARWPLARLMAFLAAMMSVFLALGSPIEPFSALLLEVHMLQHLLLMMVAAPLFWLSAPLFPFLRGLPAPVRIYWVIPSLRSRFLRELGARLTHPVTALAIYVVATWGWHVPVIYELALRSTAWHYVEHMCFLTAALLFWYGIVRPFPSRPRWSAWLVLPALLLADVQNTILSALFTFSSRPLYPHYANGPRIGGISALDDQLAAGVFMWVPGSVAFLLPLFVIAARLMYGPRPAAATVTNRRSSQLMQLPVLDQPPWSASALAAQQRGFDLLRVPLVGRFLAWRHARVALQLPLLALALLVMGDGFFSAAPGPMNLAGVLPWIHWRGVVVLVLLVGGNFVCTCCPFTLPRRLLGRVLPEGRAWPQFLQNKGLSIALMLAFFWAYEAYSLWNNPWLTAWLVLGYFVIALVVDSLYRGGSFCKYVCPIGQFNFVLSLCSPLGVSIRNPQVCATCTTKECIRGSQTSPGCELGLFQPRKQGNMDCTFCIDCIHACPHENVGVLRASRAALWQSWSNANIRTDHAVLVAVIVFAAFANAAGMVAPVLAWQDRVVQSIGLDHLTLATLSFLLLFVVLPTTLTGIVVALSARSVSKWRETLCRYGYALLPLGFAMWLAHYGFHLATSYGSIVPTTQRFLADLGLAGFGRPRWALSCCVAVADWIPRAEILALDVGLLASLYIAYRIAVRDRARLLLREFIPWALLCLALFGAGVWIVLQPMEMRGMLPSAASTMARLNP
ncbi:MAG TPA: cytochrome c oxidase assembly protein [Pirellulales bacterium]|nr:cytochrome c oxidase assembly protein [Pirellulales bacterium]